MNYGISASPFHALVIGCGGHHQAVMSHPSTKRIIYSLKKREICQLKKTVQTELSDARRGSEEAAKRSDMLLAQITSQLDRAQNQLEDFRTRPSLFERVMGKKD